MKLRHASDRRKRRKRLAKQAAEPAHIYSSTPLRNGEPNGTHCINVGIVRRFAPESAAPL